MRIRVLHAYRGRPTNEQPVLPGEYDAEDPALFGQAQYLVDNGHAVVVEGGEPTITAVETEPAVEEPVEETPEEPAEDTPEDEEPEESSDEDDADLIPWKLTDDSTGEEYTKTLPEMTLAELHQMAENLEVDLTGLSLKADVFQAVYDALFGED